MAELHAETSPWQPGEEAMMGATLIARGMIVRDSGEGHARALIFEHPTLGRFGVYYDHANDRFPIVPLKP